MCRKTCPASLIERSLQILLKTLIEKSIVATLLETFLQLVSDISREATTPCSSLPEYQVTIKKPTLEWGEKQETPLLDWQEEEGRGGRQIRTDDKK